MAIRAPLAAEIDCTRMRRCATCVSTLDRCRHARVETAGKLRGWRGPRLRLEPRIAIDVPESTATIESLRLSINEAVLDMQGRARMAGGRPEISLATRGESIDLAKLLAALPAGATGGKDLRADGTVKLDLQLEARPPALPVMHGRIDLQNGSLQMANLPDKLSAIGMQLQFAGDSLRVEELTAKFGTAPVRITGLVMQPLVPTRSHFDLQIAALDLAWPPRVAPMPAGISLAGRADVDAGRGRTALARSVRRRTGPAPRRRVLSPLVRVPVHVEAKLVGMGAVFRIGWRSCPPGARSWR